MSNQRAASVRQHEVLRVPQGWKDQDRALVIQIERILDDLYTKFGRIRLTDLADELQEVIRTQGSDIEALQQGLEETDQMVSGIEETLPEKADKSATVSTVTYNSTSKKITKTINGNTTDVVDVSTLKSAMAPFTWGQLANK